MRARTSPPRAFLRGIPVTVWMLALVIVPLGYTLIMSFYQVDSLQIIPRLTLKNYALFFTDSMYSTILGRSLLLALCVALLGVLTGYPLAYMVSLKVKHGKQALFMLSIIPLWVSYLVRIIAWKTILGNKGVINSALALPRAHPGAAFVPPVQQVRHRRDAHLHLHPLRLHPRVHGHREDTAQPARGLE